MLVAFFFGSNFILFNLNIKHRIKATNITIHESHSTNRKMIREHLRQLENKRQISFESISFWHKMDKITNQFIKKGKCKIVRIFRTDVFI